MNRVVLLALILSASPSGFCQTVTTPFHIDCHAPAQVANHAGARVDLDNLLTAPCVDLNSRPAFVARNDNPPQLFLRPLPPPKLRIPTQWPDLKVEKIPTQWPNLKLLPITEKAPESVAIGSSKR